MRKYDFIVTCFGEDRAFWLRALIQNIQSFEKKVRIILVTDDVIYRPIINAYSDALTSFEEIIIAETKWKDHARYGVRNSNYYKAYVLCFWKDFFNEDHPRSICALDDDMHIQHEAFFDGFLFAERFGLCLPQNPRIYACMNGVSEDTTDQDRNQIKPFDYIPAVNMSPMFFSYYDNFYGNGRRAVKLLHNYMNQLRENVCRGTLAMNKAMIKTGVTPMILPEQWCVGRQNAKHLKDYHFSYREKKYEVPPICLHKGQKEVRSVFRGF